MLDAVALYTDGPWRLSCEVSLSPRYISGIGTIDEKVESVIWKARARLANMDYDDILAYMDPEGAALGTVIETGAGHNLTLAGASGGITAVLYGVGIVEGPCQWGATELRSGEIGFETNGMGTIIALSVTA
jgi:hypothetical protein